MKIFGPVTILFGSLFAAHPDTAPAVTPKVQVDLAAYAHPGFLLDRVGRSWHVAYLLQGVPPATDPELNIQVGDEVLACNGRSASPTTCRGNSRGQLELILKREAWSQSHRVLYQTEKISEEQARSRDTKLQSRPFRSSGRSFRYVKAWWVEGTERDSLWLKEFGPKEARVTVILDLRGATGQDSAAAVKVAKAITTHLAGRQLKILLDTTSEGAAVWLAKRLQDQNQVEVWGQAPVGESLPKLVVRPVDLGQKFRNPVMAAVRAAAAGD